MQVNNRRICAAASQSNAAEPDFIDFEFGVVRVNNRRICAAACQSNAAEPDFIDFGFCGMQVKKRRICAAACQSNAAEPDFIVLGFPVYLIDSWIFVYAGHFKTHLCSSCSETCRRTLLHSV